jgi:cystathionine beta-lyase/cystathionine gamma-synthase
LRHGVHLVLHSATKGIAGHNDATLGVIAGERELVDAVWAYSVLHGSTPSPFDALNALRGLRTLSVRTTFQANSALYLAESLTEHPAVRAVHYPGLASHPQAELARWQMTHAGTLLAVDLAGGRHAAVEFLDRVQLLRRATSLGGPETLVCHPATTTHASLSPEEAAAVGVTDGLLRISVGLEDPTDLLTDILRALG